MTHAIVVEDLRKRFDNGQAPAEVLLDVAQDLTGRARKRVIFGRYARLDESAVPSVIADGQADDCIGATPCLTKRVRGAGGR